MSRVDDMPGYVSALIGAALMAVDAYFLGPDPLVQTDAAICVTALPVWFSNRATAAATGFLLMWVISVIATQINRRYNVEEGTSALPSSFFLIATASVPAFLTGVTPGVIMALAAILAIWWMFGCIDSEQKARPLFLAGTVISFASMTEYALIPLAAAVVVAMKILDELTPRAVLGYLFGLVTPYVLVLGFGLVSPYDVSVPWIYALPETHPSTAVITAGITALTAVILMLRMAVTPQARSSRSIALNRALNTILFILIVAMAVDFHNFQAYIPTVNLLTGFAVAGLSGDRNNTSAPTIIIGILMLTYIILFFVAI